VPHYTLTSEITLDAVLALRASLNADLPAESRLSVNDFLIKASALTLRKVPEVNSSWLTDVIRTYVSDCKTCSRIPVLRITLLQDYVDISVAVSIPDGLVTPVIRDADKKGLAAISRYVTWQ
jgi:pyruvate dehydrogenase E2 component (dihydrolipoamide acetyltransferase)